MILDQICCFFFQLSLNLFDRFTRDAHGKQELRTLKKKYSDVGFTYMLKILGEEVCLRYLGNYLYRSLTALTGKITTLEGNVTFENHFRTFLGTFHFLFCCDF